MKLKTLGKRITAAVTFIAAIGATVALSSAPANAAGTYLVFRNLGANRCLAGGVAQSGGTGSAWAAPCDSTSPYQQWQWVGAYGNELQNRATGQCLTTDINTKINAVWTGGCQEVTGQYWKYDSSTDYLWDDYWGLWLRTDYSTQGAVVTDLNKGSDSRYWWTMTAVS